MNAVSERRKQNSSSKTNKEINDLYTVISSDDNELLFELNNPNGRKTSYATNNQIMVQTTATTTTTTIHSRLIEFPRSNMTSSDLDDDAENQHDQISYFSLADLLNDSYVYIKRALVNQFDNFKKSDVFSKLLVLIKC